jgi:hypothetical protein
MISMIVFSISCVDILLAMYLAVAVSSSSAIGFPCAIRFATADYTAWRERFRAPDGMPEHGRNESGMGKRMVAFNTAEHWADDVSQDVALEIQRRLDLAGDELPSSIEAFIETHAGRSRQLSLRLN